MPVSLPRLRRAALFAVPVALATLGVAACGHHGGTSIDMPVAFSLVGQPDFTSYGINYSKGSVVNNLGLAGPRGGIATDGTHYYVADYGNNRVLGYNSIPTNGSSAPAFVLGQSDFTTNSPGTSSTKLSLPASVWIGQGHLVVADSGNNRVLIWNTLPTASNTPADVVVGQVDFNSSSPCIVVPNNSCSSGIGPNTLNGPVAASISNNRLFIADTLDNRVLIFNSIPTAANASADVVLGQADGVSSIVGQEQNGLNNPSGLWTDGFRLLVSDSSNNRVMYWSSIPHVSDTDATYEIGQVDFSRNTAGVGQAALRTPSGISSDGTRIFIADAENNRVLEFDSFPIGNGASAAAEFGQNTFSARTPNDDDQNGVADDNPSDRTLNQPEGVTDYNGVLYVTDTNNHRVMFFPD